MNSALNQLSQPPATVDVEQAVADRYSAASAQPEAALCCPVEYDTRWLEVLPQELIEKDYGCGDPSRYVRPGETVLDLGSGGGKVCYIASQIVGQQGRVIGVDINQDMLQLARRFQPQISTAIGWDNVHFHRGRIKDLALDLDRWESYLQQHPIGSTDDWLAAQQQADRCRAESPMVASDSVDVVVSNCVLNLVAPAARQQLFSEVFRVLRSGGRAVVSDIVSDEPVPVHLQNDPQLWSGCISGAFQQAAFLDAFAAAGFHGMEILSRQSEAWATVEGIEFRSLTVQAFKHPPQSEQDLGQAVVYRGPFATVTDDQGNTLTRGVPQAVGDQTFTLYEQAPYRDQVIRNAPQQAVDPQTAPPFDGRRNTVRAADETKAGRETLTQLPVSDCCGPGECC